MKPDISTLHKPDILTLQRQYYNGSLPSSPDNEYIYAGNLRVAIIQSGTSTYYWHNDHLSPRVRTDSSGNIADQRATFPFGETWYTPNSSAPWVFTSYYRDVEAEGNDYAQARTYVGGLGRFSSPDPIAGSTSDPQSLNRYSYVRNMPVMLTDPFGTCPGGVAQNRDDNQSQDSKGGGPSASDSADSYDPDPQQGPPPWNGCKGFTDQGGGGGIGTVSINGGEGFAPGDGASGLIGSGDSNGSVSFGGGAGGWIPDGIGGYYNPTTGCYTNRGQIVCNWQGYAETFGDSTPDESDVDSLFPQGPSGSGGNSGSSAMSLKVTKDCFDRLNGTRDINYQLIHAPGPVGDYTVAEQLSNPQFADSSEVGGFHDNLRPTLFGTVGATTTNTQYFLVYPTAQGLNNAQWVPIVPMSGSPIKFNTINMTNGVNPAQNIIKVNGKLAPDC